MIAIIAAIGLAAAVPLAGIPPNKSAIATYSFSKGSCADWTIHRQSKLQQAHEGWISGFIAGLNAWGPGNGDIAPEVNGTALLAWVDQYCTQNPLDSITTAGFKLADELVRRARR